MNHPFCKYLMSVIFLTVSVSFAAQAGTANVTIKATVVERFTVNNIPEVIFSEAEMKSGKSVNIGFTSNLANSPSKAKVTVSANKDKYEGESLLLEDKAKNKLRMEVMLDGNKFIEGKVEVKDVKVGTPVKLNLKPNEAEDQIAGEYSGQLLVSVEKA